MSSSGIPNNFPALAQGIQKWGLAHWTYIVVALLANMVGVFVHI